MVGLVVVTCCFFVFGGLVLLGDFVMFVQCKKKSKMFFIYEKCMKNV